MKTDRIKRVNERMLRELAAGFGFDRELQLKSLRWIAQMEREPGCAAVLCSHDPAVPAGPIEF